MDYEKKYKEALEIARKINSGERVNASSGWTGLEVVFPELRESEDERIMKAHIDALKVSETIGELKFRLPYPTREECIAHLEKQKKQKPVDFPTTDEEVNEFLETHPKVEVPEKYKTPDFVFKKQEYESYPIISKDTTSVKPAEWSEEDADILNCCISSIEEAKENRYAYKETDGDTSYDREIAFLKSLRNRVGKESLQSWKPSEEQMRALKKVAYGTYQNGDGPALRSLYEQLKKLM